MQEIDVLMEHNVDNVTTIKTQKPVLKFIFNQEKETIQSLLYLSKSPNFPWPSLLCLGIATHVIHPVLHRLF